MLRKKAQDLLPSVWRRLCIRRSRERHSAHLTRTGRPSMSQGDVVENPCGTNHSSSGLRRGPQYVVSALRLRPDFVLYSTLVLHGWGTVFPLRAQTDLSLLQNPILDESDRRSMMFSFVERNLPPIELPATLAAWEARKRILLEQIHRLVGLEDLQHRGPIKWIARGLLDRDAYTIEKILYESYPGMMVPALVYTPKGLTAPAAAIVSITGHTTCDGKANVEAQARSVNLVRRGLIVVTIWVPLSATQVSIHVPDSPTGEVTITVCAAFLTPLERPRAWRFLTVFAPSTISMLAKTWTGIGLRLRANQVEVTAPIGLQHWIIASAWQFRSVQ
jgi:hypothetical protein